MPFLTKFCSSLNALKINHLANYTHSHTLYTNTFSIGFESFAFIFVVPNICHFAPVHNCHIKANLPSEVFSIKQMQCLCINKLSLLCKRLFSCAYYYYFFCVFCWSCTIMYLAAIYNFNQVFRCMHLDFILSVFFDSIYLSWQLLDYDFIYIYCFFSCVYE